MAEDRAAHHTAVRLTDGDLKAVRRLSRYWDCNASDAIRTAIRIADALAKEVAYVPLPVIK